MTSVSRTHLVLIPSYNTGPKLFETVNQALENWGPVWVVVDGSTDRSEIPLRAMAETDPRLRILSLPQNSGKGAAILHALRDAIKDGFTHVLTMDSDGQHAADHIRVFMAASMDAPDAVILGRPTFDSSAPLLRVCGRRLSNLWANAETLWSGIGDSLFGFRVYPANDLLAVMEEGRWMRRFDFEPEAAVRLSWRGLPMINIATPVRYFRADEGGVSHFNYLRDNALLTGMHARLVVGAIIRWRSLLKARRSRK